MENKDGIDNEKGNLTAIEEDAITEEVTTYSEGEISGDEEDTKLTIKDIGLIVLLVLFTLIGITVPWVELVVYLIAWIVSLFL